MGVRSAFGTTFWYLATVFMVELVVAPGAALFLLVVWVGNGAPATTDVPTGPVPDIGLLLSLLLGAWFVVESRSLARLVAFGVAVWVLFAATLAVASVVGSPFEPFGVWSVAVGVVFLVGVPFVYLGAYRLVYPESFAEQKRQFDLDG